MRLPLFVRKQYLPVFLIAGVLFLFGCTSSEEDKTKKTAIGILKSALLHENYFVRSAAVKAIGEMGDPTQIPLIIPGFKDPISFVRLFSVESAATLHGPDSLKLLLAASSDPDPMVRVGVVKAFDDLANHGKVDSIPIEKLLEPFLKDPDPTVNFFAIASRARHGNKNTLIELEKGLLDDERIHPATVALGRTKKKEAVPILIRAIDNPDEMVRMLAAEGLGEIADKEAYASLTRLISDKEATVRGAAATSLGKIGDPRAIPILESLLGDSIPVVAISAAEGLTRLGKTTLPIYKKALGHADYGVRHFAIGSLHKTAGQDAMPLLIKALSDNAPRVRIAAVRAIGSIGGADAVPVLKAQLNDADLAVRAYAAGNVVRLQNGIKKKKEIE